MKKYYKTMNFMWIQILNKHLRLILAKIQQLNIQIYQKMLN